MSKLAGAGDLERDDDDPRPFPGPGAKGPNQQYKFTSEELRVLRGCNRDSFYQRCLPLSTILGGSVLYGVKSGFLKPSVNYGATPKVIGAIVVGYFLGKFSYQAKCAERLMQLPNSPIADMLRQRKRGGFQENLDSAFGPSMSLSPFSGINQSDTYSDVGPPPENSLDLDTSRPELNGLDDTYRPSLDNPIFEEEEMPPVQKTTTSYDELRKQNRDDHQYRRIGGFRDGPEIPKSASKSDEQKMPKTRTNKYGDSFE